MNYLYMEKQSKKILFVIPELAHGGTNKSLENILSLIDFGDFSVSVYSLAKEGVYRELFSNYNLQSSSTVVRLLRKKAFLYLYAFLKKVFNISLLYYIYRLESLVNRSLNKYDIVVSFQEGATTSLVSHLSPYKVAWVHCDYDLYRKEISESEYKIEREQYTRYDKIICVSEYTKGTFCRNFPDIDPKKVECVYNMLDIDAIRKKSKAHIADWDDTPGIFRMISVGRMNFVKQFNLIPGIARKIIDITGNDNFKWIIIAPYSKLSDIVEDEIVKNKVDNNVYLLGGRDNPYPYIKKANLLISTSAYEACPYVVNEAKVLHTPVVSTNYPSAYELIDGNNGIVCKLEQMPKIISDLMCNTNNMYSRLKSFCDDYNYTNDRMIGQTTNILNHVCPVKVPDDYDKV